MSIHHQRLHQVSRSLSDCQKCRCFTAKLAKKVTSDGFPVHEVFFAKRGSHKEYISQLKEVLASWSGGELEQQQVILPYEGISPNNDIRWIKNDDPLVADQVSRLSFGVSHAIRDGSPLDPVFNASLMRVGGLAEKTDKAILVTLNRPVTVAKNRFFWEANCFHPISGSILSLQAEIDAILVSDTLYLTSGKAERIFVSEEAMLKRADSTITQCLSMDFVAMEGEHFLRDVAAKMSNARRLVHYDPARGEILKDSNRRKALSKAFRLKLDGAGRIDITSEQEASRLIKMLCKQAMHDVFVNSPVEVDNARDWQ